MYINCHSYYSLRYGTMSVEELVEKAAELQIESMALTDINNTSGIIDFVKICNEKNIHPIAGIEFRQANKLYYIGIAQNNEGFKELNDFLSDILLHRKELPIRAPLFQHAYIIYPFGRDVPPYPRENEWIGIHPAHLNHIDIVTEKIWHSKCVIWFPVTFANYSDFKIHQHLRAIDNNTLITKLLPEQLAKKHEVFLPIDELKALYSNYPYIIRNTEKLINSCSISFDFNASKNKKVFTGSRYDDRLLLEKLAYEGMKTRYGTNHPEAMRRIKQELEVIDKLGFSAYFLIAWDIIRYATSRGFYHVGRGSGANSIVAYCLKITNVDPIELDLYFERFINPKRSSPPDFDIDFSWRDRDEVIDYIFKRYGTRHTAFLAAISTFRDRSIIRELGKANGLPKEEIDMLVRNPDHPTLRNEIVDKIIEIGNRIVDFPNVRSIHAGGILISELPITYYTALDLPPKGFQTTQWDMYTAETLRFEKIDILSQRGIGHIKDCVEIIRQNKGVNIDMFDIQRFKSDARTQLLLQRGRTLGCFYIESPAMRGLLQKLRCSDYRTLVAASSIIRPGVAKSGMMKEYIRRYHNPEQTPYLHPKIKELLHETFGVMVYQEDVIKVAHYFAGLDLADADVLRRAMSGKYRSRKEFEKIAEKFFTNCHSRGYPDWLTREIWRQMESFAGYSFSKAHSASYAVESFQSLFLKAHYPIEHMVAVINNFGGFYPTWVYIHEARKWGGIIHLPCVNQSRYITWVYGRDVYLGFIHIQQVDHQFLQKIETDRDERGLYSNLTDFIDRLSASIEQTVVLIRVGAFRFTQKTKKELLWEAYAYIRSRKDKAVVQPKLFSTLNQSFQLPVLRHNPIDDAFDEMELLGFVVSCRMIDLVNVEELSNNDKTLYKKVIYARQMNSMNDKTVSMAGQLVTIKNVRTSTHQWMHMATFIDAEGNFFDTVHFPASLKKYKFKGDGIYLLVGKIAVEFDFPSLIVDRMIKVPLLTDHRYADSRMVSWQENSTTPLQKTAR